jgi:hypothetical protein
MVSARSVPMIRWSVGCPEHRPFFSAQSFSDW